MGGVRAAFWGLFGGPGGPRGLQGCARPTFLGLGGAPGWQCASKRGSRGALFGPPFAEKVLKNVVNMCISEKLGFPGGPATDAENSKPNSCVYQFQGGLKS